MESAQSTQQNSLKQEIAKDAEATYDAAVSTGKRVGEAITDEAKQLVSNTVGEAKGQAQNAFTQQRDKATEGLNQVADALRRTGQEMSDGEGQGVAQYAEVAAEQVERLSGYLQSRELGDLMNDVRDIARRQPEMFVAGALAAGFLLGRFLKSSGTQSTGSQYNQSGAYGYNSDQYGTYSSGQYGSAQPSSGQNYGYSSGTSWQSTGQSGTQNIPITNAEERYGR